ncbi:hypothetical protein BDV38DRAFT_293230 [Aspergillus pseudotamarii]|uniref:Uncharacterized protein n=1 Tax=Aspergillus pseudotamarii TaxID=132259 RepID=A0A5N6SV25_ASPPS|nr:uncharacterized protein BDV38DRAFT_293230 [Aspergillus pseudotamarii]KAE8137233.1 hypothetical protein BDV38DRAFT_293230 [Aspergillus pseudotamarii]
MNFNVPRPSLPCLIGGASFALTFVVTLLDGLCLTSFKSFSPNVRSIESAVTALSAANCVVLAITILFWLTDIDNENLRQLSAYRRRVYYLLIAYSAITTGVTAGGIAWGTAQVMIEQQQMSLRPRQRLLLVTRSVIWAISVLTQGVLGGLLLMTLAKQTSRSRWLTSLSHDLDAIHEELAVDNRLESTKQPQLVVDSPKKSTDRKRSCDGSIGIQQSTSSAASLISKRYSGRTLYQQDSKHSSIDFNPPITYPECVVMRNTFNGGLYGHSSYTAGADGDAGSRKTQGNKPEFRCSLDTLRRQNSLRRSSDTSRSLQPEAPNKGGPPKLILSDESNIHPLFRSSSPTPPPTAMPGTTVIASPAAGQTISMKALHRMKSTNSLRSYTPRSRSPLFERTGHVGEGVHSNTGLGDGRCELKNDQTFEIPKFVMAADLRRSITQYEKRYDLMESPHES